MHIVVLILFVDRDLVLKSLDDMFLNHPLPMNKVSSMPDTLNPAALDSGSIHPSRFKSKLAVSLIAVPPVQHLVGDVELTSQGIEVVDHPRTVLEVGFMPMPVDPGPVHNLDVVLGGDLPVHQRHQNSPNVLNNPGVGNIRGLVPAAHDPGAVHHLSVDVSDHHMVNRGAE